MQTMQTVGEPAKILQNLIPLAVQFAYVANLFPNLH